MKTFTLISLLTISSLSVFATPHHHQYRRHLAENREYFAELMSPATASAVYRMQRAEMLTLNSRSEKQINYSMKLDSTVYTQYEEGTWRKDMLDEFRYDANWRTTEIIQREWDDEVNGWVLEYRTEFTYDNRGWLSEMFNYGEGYMDNVFGLLDKMSLHYNNTGRLDSIFSYSHLGDDAWELDYKQYYHYNNAGRITENVMVEYDEFAETWLPVYTTRYTYDGNGNRIKSESIIHDEDEEMLFSFTNYFFSAQGKVEASEYSTINFFTQVMEKKYRTEYKYNGFGDQSEYVDFDFVNNEWVLDYKEELIYNNAINFSEAAFPYLVFATIYSDGPSELQFSKIPIESRGYDRVGDAWVPVDKSVFHYSGGASTAVGNLTTSGVSHYPNPANEHIHFAWDGNYDLLTLEVYQLTGAQVINQTVTRNTAVNTGSLTRGMYLYRMSNQGELIHAGKFLKR